MTSSDTSSPRERRRAETRREIIDAAWEQCHEHGLAGLSLRDLAERVGLRASSLYSYVDAKNDIYDAMFADGQRALLDRLATAAPAGTTVTRDEFVRGAEAFFDFCAEDPVRYQLLFQRTLPDFRPSEDSYALARQVLAVLGRQLAALGATEVEEIDLWTAVITGLVDQQVANDPGGRRWRRLVPRAVDRVLGHHLTSNQQDAP